MEALLIYNPNAGGAAEDQAKLFQEELERQGYRPAYRATKNEDELDRILPEADGLVVVVGGDGSLRAVTTRLVDRDLPIFLIPNGTANNVGRTLGIEGEPMDILRRLEGGTPREIDMGRMVLPWGETYFLEGAGCGLFAEALARYQPEDGKSFLRGIKTLIELLTDLPSRPMKLRLDGVEEEGEYLLVEAMNMGAVGPKLTLAPSADPSDGKFDVLKIRADQRESYLTYMTALLNNDVENLESIERSRVRELEVKWDGFPLHQDASCLKMDDMDRGIWVKFDLKPRALKFLIPQKVENPQVVPA